MMYSRNFSAHANTGTKKLRRYIFLSLYALFSLLSIPLPTIFLLFFIFFPFLLEFGHTLLTYSFYNKSRIVDKPLTISPLIKRWRYTFVYRHLCFTDKNAPGRKRNHFRFPPGGILSSFLLRPLQQLPLLPLLPSPVRTVSG